MADWRGPGACLTLCLLLLVQGPANGLGADTGQDVSSETRLGLLRGSESALDLSRAQQLSSEPKVFLFDGFLSHDEVQHLKRIAQGHLDPPSGHPLGSATFLRKYQDGLVRRVEDRISDWLFLPRSAPEAVKPLRYNAGQTFDVHYEFYSNPSGDRRKGDRAATVLLFLSDVEGGGEVVFPRATVDEARATQQRAQGALPGTCTGEGLVVKPREGAALFFINLTPDGKTDPTAEFRECPVTAGEKWMAAKWVAVQRYSVRRDPTECIDEHEMCATWATAGECQRNPKYMVGESGFIGNCRKACKACVAKA